jgi:hypothetical protein
LAQQPFALKAQPGKGLERRRISWIDVRCDPVQLEV